MLEQCTKIAGIPARSLESLIEDILTERTNFLDDTQSQDSVFVHQASYSAVKKAVDHETLIRLVLPAFPAKSSNRRKTLGPLPDMGELLGLEYLNNLCSRIASIYTPGAKLVICSDGRVFNDLVWVDDDSVNRYRKSLEKMISERSLNYLSIFSLEDQFAHCDYARMRAEFIETYCDVLAVLKQRIFEDADSRAMFNGIHRFIFEDAICHEENRMSRNQIRNKAKGITYQVIQRSDGWSRLIAECFPGSVRLSIHPHFASSPKLGVKLVNAGDRWATPWHNCVLRDHTGFRLIKHQEALELGARLHYFENQYAYFDKS